MWLEDSRIQYDDDLEPRRYDIDDDVYVADARFEDLEALFRQAEEAANSISGLMYRQSVEWWEAIGRRELHVTVDQLFDAIHYDEQGRMTGKATIAWELWRRLAFQSAGEGKYLFRPEKGDRLRSVVSKGSARKATATRLPVEIKKDRSLRKVIAGSRPPVVPPPQETSKGKERTEGEPTVTIPGPPAAPKVARAPDIGIRRIVYPIPFSDDPLPQEVRKALSQRDSPFYYNVNPSLWGSITTGELDTHLMGCIAERSANRFVTPREVADFMVNLAQPRPGECVVDICCGTGIFLVKALRFVKEVYGEDADLELYGVDIYAPAVEAARLSLMANGAKRFTLVHADSLQEQGGHSESQMRSCSGKPAFRRRQGSSFPETLGGSAPGRRARCCQCV